MESVSDLVTSVVFMHERVRKLVVWIPFDDHDESKLDGGRGRRYRISWKSLRACHVSRNSIYE